MSVFAVLALAFYAAFIVLAGAGRVWIQYRRTGDTGIRHRRRGPDGPGRWAGLAPIGSLGPGVGALGVPGAVGLRWVGVALAAFGIGATLAAQLAMGGSWRIGVEPTERTTLVTDGPFRIVRNPIFAAVAVKEGRDAWRGDTCCGPAVPDALACDVARGDRRPGSSCCETADHT